MDTCPGVSTSGVDAPAEERTQEKNQLSYRKRAQDSLDLDISYSKIKGHIPASAQKAVEEIEDLVQAVKTIGSEWWSVVGHHSLPDWLKDNDYLIYGHRPQLNSYWACMKSIFRIHTETGNIWTHLLGCVLFVCLGVYLFLYPRIEMQLIDHMVFITYFLGAIICLSFSWLFHTFCCHSPPVGRLFSKLDYCGISALVMASFVPWLYYSFYCDLGKIVFYMSGCIIMGTACITVSMLDRFADASYRSVRAALFIAFGLFGVVPTIHYVWQEGFYRAVTVGGVHWLLLMAMLYIGGAVIYALRFPERLWPGKFDYWGQSHQIFHICVVLAALVHCHGIIGVAVNNARSNSCVD